MKNKMETEIKTELQRIFDGKADMITTIDLLLEKYDSMKVLEVYSLAMIEWAHNNNISKEEYLDMIAKSFDHTNRILGHI